MDFILKYSLLFFCFIISCICIEGTFVDGVKYRCDYKYFKSCKAWIKYHPIPATFQEARLRCNFEGAILASPISPDIRAAMARATGRIPIFTGIHATFSRGDYNTVDGIPLDLIPHAWEANALDMDIENCIAFNGKGNLADVECNRPRPYMCIREKIEELNACGTPDPDYHFDSETQKCYKFHKVPRKYKRAYMACSSEGGHLLVINSEKEAQAIRDLFEKNPPDSIVGDFQKDIAFIGVTDWNEHGDWKTIQGEPLAVAGYSKYAAGEPHHPNATRFCGTVSRTGLLGGANCDNYFTFICEKTTDSPPVCAAQM